MASTDLISRLSTAFNSSIKDGHAEKPDYLTRDIGGQFRTNHPYISGYFQVVFNLPEHPFGNSDNTQIASKWLHSTVEMFQPHSEAVTKVDLVGQGQMGSSFTANLTVTREFTLGFREYQFFPILNILRRWSIWDGLTGVTALKGNEFIPKNYKGQVTIFQTKPTGAQNRDIEREDIEEIYVYNGVFPTSLPVDTAASADVNTNEMVQHSVTFSFDGYPLRGSDSLTIMDKALGMLNGLRYIGGDGEFSSTAEKIYGTVDTLNPWGTTPSEKGSAKNAGADSA